MPTYEFGPFDPPAPVIRATIRARGDTLQEDVPMLIDSGSDATIVPLQIVVALGATLLPATFVVETYTGERITYPRADLTIEFFRYRMHGRYLVAASEYGILGRNILNLLNVTLDGPRQEWSI